MRRRDVLRTAGLTMAAGVLAREREAGAQFSVPPLRKPLKGRLKQSVSRWCYEKIPMADFCKAVADMGLLAIDLLAPEEWPIAKAHGLVCSMGYANAGSIPEGIKDPKNHKMIIDNLTAMLPKAREAGVPNLITFFGNRRGMSDDEAIRNSIACLNQIKKVAEDNGVTVCVELLNSKVDHKDYIGDHTPFGVKVVGEVDSPRVKLLYDIYHMQIMEGDVIRTIRTYKDHLAHFHTGGVPGRHELDATQELYWPAVAEAIVNTGYTGYFAHEFVPTRDPLTSLREAVALCDV